MAKNGQTTITKTALGEHLDEVIAQLKRGPSVTIGLQGEKGEATEKGGSMSVAQIAAIHEFGAPAAGIPERSFIRSNDANNASKYRTQLQKLKGQVMGGSLDALQALGVLGLQIESDIKANIRAGIEPELKPATIKRKGSSTPLIDTGQMINSITSVVNESDKG